MLIDIKYEVLDKKTGENASEKFFRKMKEKFKGEKKPGPCESDANVMSYKIKANSDNVLISDRLLYARGNASTIIFGEDYRKISRIKSGLEKQMGNFKLKFVEKGGIEYGN